MAHLPPQDPAGRGPGLIPARFDVFALLALAALLLLPGLGLRDVWNPDEARYAEVAREMAVSGQWALPHLNGELYTQKPPLFFWAIAASGAVTGGVSALDSRLPSALGALGAVLLVFWIAGRAFGRRGAWLTVAAYLTCFKLLWQGRFGQIDMFLGFWVVLAVACWWRAHLGRVESPAGDDPKGDRFIWGFWLATGFATLAKGPVGLLPPLLSILAYLALTGDRGEIRRLKIGRGLLLWAGVVLLWLVPAGLAGGVEYLEQIVFKQNVTRYANPWHHHQPWYYYLSVLPGDFFPWAFFLPAAVVSAWRELRIAAVPGRRFRFTVTGDPRRRGLLLAVAWAVVTLLFFSLSPAKRSVYIFSCYPALALLVGGAFDAFLGRAAGATAALGQPLHRRWWTVPCGILVFVGALLTVALPVRGPKEWIYEVVGAPFLIAAALVTTAVAVGGALAWRAFRRGAAARAAGWLAGAMAVLQLVAGLYLLPALDVMKSARGLSNVYLELSDPEDPYGVYARPDAGFPFYTHRFGTVMLSPEEFRAFAARPERVWLFAERDQLRKVEPWPELWEVARDADRDDGYLLLTNRPPRGVGQLLESNDVRSVPASSR